MRGTRKTLLLFLPISFLVQIVVSSVTVRRPVECFVCGSKFPYSCEEFDPKNTSFIETCPDNTKSCLKSLATYNNVTVVRRQCSKDQAINQCTSNSMKGASVTFCSCEENLCNQQEGPIRASMALLLLMSSLMSVIQP
eukprot:01279.XXX_2603_3166_1 [CDS] Oithona nana genome sequencing.